ncbi:MAG TPA: nucleotidyltransferase domain-containing protein [Phycisphaerae bacterium]|nr:nucleotidyltransferase domain-containing protein [Phycisphaerae bacterium]
MGIRIDIDQERLAAFCRKWRITELSLFGSVLREDFRPDSDVDVLVSFADDARWGLFDICRMEDDLRGFLGREVDLVTRNSVEQSRNYIRRKHILENLETIHAAG